LDYLNFGHFIKTFLSHKTALCVILPIHEKSIIHQFAIDFSVSDDRIFFRFQDPATRNQERV
jgi:hypothetical protein